MEIERSFKETTAYGICVGLITGLAFALGGFACFSHQGTEMGGVLFLFVPFATGFAIAIVTDVRRMVYANLILSAIVALVTLFYTRLETPLCAILAAPLLLVCLFIGAGIARIFRWLCGDRGNHRMIRIIALLILPLFMQGADLVEQPYLLKPREETITNKLVVQATPQEAWDQIKAVDKISAPKPWMMYVGLYEPVSCTLSEEHVGALRTCHFKNGDIFEKVEVWDPPRLMKMKIERTTLPGRLWLGYIDATYELTQHGKYTEIARTTGITSRLGPDWYWRIFERMGVETEHQYLFDEFAKRIAAIKSAT